MNCILSILFCIIFIASGCSTLAQKTPISQEKVSISTSRNKPTHIDTLPSYEYGVPSTVITNADDKRGTIKFSQGDALAINMGNPCAFCAETIKISPNLTVPISPTESIQTGPRGATLKRMGKTDKGLYVVEGDAQLVIKKYE
jgi:hypothetical protein